jgi:pimeloyl-ACP methyl ester carboxylesterase
VAPAILMPLHARIGGSKLINFPDAPHRVQCTNSAEFIAAIRDFISRRGKE